MTTLIDSFGRSITYLRISLTDRCNLRCVYCMPKDGLQWQPLADQLSADEILQVVETAPRWGVKRVQLTGGEPLVYPHVVEIVRRITSIPEIEEVSLTTNAILHFLAAYVCRLKIRNQPSIYVHHLKLLCCMHTFCTKNILSSYFSSIL